MTRTKTAVAVTLILVLTVRFSPASAGDDTHNASQTEARNASKNAAKDEQLAALVQLLHEVNDPSFQRDILQGMHKALNGRRRVSMPAGWAKVFPQLLRSRDADVQRLALQLGVIFGDPQALAALRKRAADDALAPAKRQQALQQLVQQRDEKTATILKQLLDEQPMRAAAIRHLAAYDDAKIPKLLLQHYPQWSDAEQRDALLTLASRPQWALQLLDAIKKNRIPSRDVSAFVIRQMTALDDKRLSSRIRQVWGTVRPTSEQRAQRIVKYKQRLTDDVLKKADLTRGRLVFRKTCSSCHRLFDEGKHIGPELTGSQRTNLDYLLENLLDPNAVIGRDYRMSVFVTDAGRIITGIVKEESDRTLTVQTANAQVVLDKNDIERRKRSPVSLMPEGQLEKLPFDDVRDLIAYLMSPRQVALPEQPPSADSRGSSDSPSSP